MTELVQVKCPKCQQDMRIHQPMIVRVDNGVMSQVSLVPSWSADERVCQNCGSTVAPVFAPELPIGWVAMQQEQPAEQKRIILPTLQGIKKR
jgi:hypothetical protein